MNHGAASNCVKEHHAVWIVGDTECLALWLKAPDHQASSECECNACMESEHQDGCMNPDSCFSKAKVLLNTLLPKWDPCTGIKDEQPEVDPVDYVQEAHGHRRKHM
ncbi:hypothetical protein L208DRAFT_1311630 [Tricholoma matsutake]|nr:hypothetical protein L208DRAFT_1311630 [Tricholoma matsutake 945]